MSLIHVGLHPVYVLMVHVTFMCLKNVWNTLFDVYLLYHDVISPKQKAAVFFKLN